MKWMPVALAGLCACQTERRSSSKTDQSFSQPAGTPILAALASDNLAVGASEVLVAGDTGITDIAVLGDAITFGTRHAVEREGRIARVYKPGSAGAASAGVGAKTLVAGQDVRTLAVNQDRVFWLNGAGSSVVLSQYREASGTYHRFFPPRNSAIDKNDSLWSFEHMLVDSTQVFLLSTRLSIADPVPVPTRNGPNSRWFGINDQDLFILGCRSGSGYIIRKSKLADDGPMIFHPPCITGFAVSNDWLAAATYQGDIQVTTLQPLGDLRSIATTNTSTLAILPPFVVAVTDPGALVTFPLTGGTMATLVPSGVWSRDDYGLPRLAVDADSVYWISADRTSISRTRVK